MLTLDRTQFAYNEVSFMLIRLLQNVSGIHLMQEVNPKAIPPEGYADSPACSGGEKVFFRNHLTLYIQVNSYCFVLNIRC